MFLHHTHGRLKATALVLVSIVSLVFGQSITTCSLDEVREDPNLQVMEYDVGDGLQTTKVYVEPDVTSFYKDKSDLPSSQKVVPKFNGYQGKFINLSNETVVFSWESNTGQRHVMRYLEPFTATGTATFPTHTFVMSSVEDQKEILERFVVGEYPDNIYAYDPFHVKENPVPPSSFTDKHKKMYTSWRKTMLFNDQYLVKTGRSYLANYLRNPPTHFMWPADYFGQEHWITSLETHFTSLPPQEKLTKITTHGKKRRLRDDQPRILSEYRDTSQPIINMTLRVVSVAPRVLEIPNFLSSSEVEHVLDLAHRKKMALSTTGDSTGEETTQLKTRTSKNTWVAREESPIIDAIYRRAADLERIDEALLRHRDADERPDVPGRKPVCEQLQLVHYGLTEEYTAHHDFGYAKLDDEHQAARFSTLLLYLNEPEEGGETSFPRWANAETFHELAIKPEIGKAALFYSQLPDGNFDDLSHHAAKPIVEGEKFLINLWVWDPIYD
mmetsp:Transcript_12899/g.24498  ORF Transcript_12899/g.24498 Transcript_12899/m.24498 type:complete len:498 (-) Transcript_12899:63-1556(-)